MNNDIKIRDLSAKPSLRSRLSAAFFDKWYLMLCFAIPAFLLFLIYLFRGAYPNGEGSVLVLDLNGQYVYFFEGLRDLITEGGSFTYTFRRALGGEFMGIYAYYLASPLSYIVALFPKEHMTEAIYTLLVLKCGLSGLTFGYYVHKTRSRRPVAAVTFSVMWALCAYAVVMQHNLMWTDNIILFPLVLLGIEQLIKRGNIALYVISLSLSILSNFYIGYMTCIFAGFYFFLCYFSKSRDDRNPDGIRYHFVKRLALFAAASACAVCIGAVIILPTYYSLTLGKTDFSHPKFFPTSKFDFADMLTKFYFGSYDTVRPEGLPFLYTGMLSLLTAPLYFVCKKIPLREKVTSAVTAVLLVFSMNVSTLDLVWHGMQKPNWLNYRYAYMLCFFILYWGMRVFNHLKDISYKWVIGTFSLSILVLIILQKTGYKNLPYLEAILPSMLILFILVLTVRGVKARDASFAAGAKYAILILVCVEMTASSLVNLNALDKDVVFSKRSGYRSFLDRVSVAADDIAQSDTSFYRAEKTFMRKSNDNMALGLRGLSSSTSTLNEETIVFLNRMGYASKSHWSKYMGENPVSDSLLGIKYIIAETDDRVYEASLFREYSDKGMITYENKYALPLVTAVSERLTNSPFTDDGVKSPFTRLNDLVSNMLGGKDIKVFREAKVISVSTDGVRESSVAGHAKYAKVNTSSDGKVNFTVEIDSDEPLYCFFPSKYTRTCDLLVNGKDEGTYFDNETYRIVDLGTFSGHSSVVVTLSLQKDELYLWEDVPYFCYLDEAAFEEAFTELKEYGGEVTSENDDTLRCRISVPEGREQIFTSIAYDAGWRVVCDGKEVETSKVLDGLLTFRLEPGEHDLTLEYRPESVKYGNIISLLGLLAFALLCAGNLALRKRTAKARFADDDGKYDLEINDAGSDCPEDDAVPASEAETEYAKDAPDDAETDDTETEEVEK